jgi:nucleoside-diphosphate-sugar epimerase
VAACLKHRPHRLVHVSSLSVLDHADRDPSQPVTEQSALEPHPERRGAYTQTKGIAEACVLDAIAQENLSAVVIRPGQIFGPGAETTTPNGTLALAGRWIAVGSTARTIPLVYIDDIVDALLLAADNPDAVGRVFNVVDPAPVTQQQYLDACRRMRGGELRLMRVRTWLFLALATGVEILGAALKRPVPLTRYRVRSLRPLANFDLSAARDILGWQPRVGVQRGLETTFGAESSAVDSPAIDTCSAAGMSERDS